MNVTSDELFYVISRAVRRDNFEISRVVFIPNITYKSCYYLFIQLPADHEVLTLDDEKQIYLSAVRVHGQLILFPNH